MAKIDGRTFGIVVDAVFHSEEIVVKPMSAQLRHVPMFSGNTILGDGSVILTIDPTGIADAIASTAAPMWETKVESQDARAADDAANATVALLLFRAGSTQLKAVPLSLVTRLEEVDGRYIEFSGGRHLLQYRGQLLPIVCLDDESRIRAEGTQPLLVFSYAGRSLALAVDEIVDIVEDRLQIDVPGRIPGSLGSAVIDGHATEIIDVGHFLPLAFEQWFRRSDIEAKSLLLVDDSAFFRNMLAPVLNAAGCDVTVTASGKEALDMLQGGGISTSSSPTSRCRAWTVSSSLKRSEASSAS